MDSTITINAHGYHLTKQLPTSNVRSTLVGTVPYKATAGYLETKEGGVPVIRTQRKIEKAITLSSGEQRNVSVQVVSSLPTDVAASELDSVQAELASWIGQTDFLTEVKTGQI